MTKTILYTVTKADLKNFAKEVINEVGLLSPKSSKNIIPYSDADRLTQKEAADFLGKSVTTIIKYKKEKKIPYHEMGSNIFYFKTELLQASKKGLLEKKKA